MKTIVFDTMMLLKFFKGERGAKRTLDAMEKIERGEIIGAISTITLTEVYYILARKSKKRAEERYDYLVASVLEKVPVGVDVAKIAGEIKTKYPIPIADAVIAATAKFLETRYIFTDDEHCSEIDGIETLTSL
ncbi:MAG: PIN domain-containing protein [Methanocellales archaeon]|nr:PIN domain-containing protein [Methanocellales archaeon]